MSRLVHTRSAIVAQSPDTAEADESALSRIAKFIPAEILAFYTMWTQGAAQLPWKEAVMPMCLGGLIVGAVMSYVYFSRFFPNTPPESRKAHRIMAPLAFLIYGYTIMGAALPHLYIPGVALMATSAITVMSAVYQPTAKPQTA